MRKLTLLQTYKKLKVELLTEFNDGNMFLCIAVYSLCGSNVITKNTLNKILREIALAIGDNYTANDYLRESQNNHEVHFKVVNQWRLEFLNNQIKLLTEQQ